MNFDAANVIVAIITLLISGSFSRIAYLAAVKQNKLSASSIAADWQRDLRSWASEAVDVLSEVAYTCRVGDPEPNEKETACIARARHLLSALIDRGRFLLPNEREEQYGDHKPRAFRGLRHPALDALVAADRILGNDMGLLSFPDKKSALIGIKREFVSIVQQIIDPQSHNEVIAETLRSVNTKRSGDPTLGGLLPDASKVPTGADGLLRIASKRFEAARR